MILVTSFHRKGYEAYGRRMLETAMEFFPGKIMAYSEDGTDWDLKHERIEYRNLLEVNGCAGFLHYCDRHDVFHGRTPFGYDYNHDAARFCKKVFAQYDVLWKEKDKVLWLDADSVIKKPVTEAWFSDIFKGNPVFYLGREGFHCETGVIGFDPSHSDFGKFLDQYVRVYQTGRIFSLPRWHDCAALDWAIEESKITATNLSPNWKPGDSLDVLETTILTDTFTHYKGNKKWKSTDSEAVLIA